MPERHFSFTLPAYPAQEGEPSLTGERVISVEIPGFATQANSEALVRLGDTAVLVTVVMNASPREGVDFFPLIVDFEERYYAAGELRSSRFMKRESRPSDEAILAGRLVDRTIRPRFPNGMRNEVQIIATTLSYDQENDPDVLAIIGASVALSLSDIPWNGPIAGVRVADIDGELVMNPVQSQRKRARFEFIVSGTKDRINMLEAGAQEIPEDAALNAVGYGHDVASKIAEAVAAFAKTHGKPKTSLVLIEPNAQAREALLAFLGDRLEQALFSPDVPKAEKMDRVNALKRETIQHFAALDTIAPREADSLFEMEIDRLVHEYAIERKTRPDGRAPNELRRLDAQVGYLPRTHGSSIFSRGDTRALATVTLAGPGENLIVEGMEGEWKKHFMLHYNFPPFSVGDVKPLRGPGRREIGHGALAERAVTAVVPPKATFPYTVRVVSEILSSNGSSSMATTCAASLALMDAGVPLTRHVAGIAMGLMMADDGRFTVLTDIQGPEDHHGDMDLKIAGTSEGITGIQMDVKIEGITKEILEAVFAQAREARLEILSVMEQALAQPRPSVSQFAPKVEAFTINPEKIRDLIGPGGRVINGIIARTGATIDVEDTGEVFVTAIDPHALARAVEEVRAVTRDATVGETYQGTVTRTFPFGVMVEIFSGKEGLVHMTDLSPLGIRRPDDVFRSGMAVSVIVKEIDPQGRVNLTLANPDELPRRDFSTRPPGGQYDDRQRHHPPHHRFPFRRHDR